MFKSGDVFKIAAGHNNMSGFVSVHKLHPSMRVYYHLGAIVVTWNDYESREIDGALFQRPIGNPKTSWNFPRLVRCAYDEFRAICPNESAEVTIRTWNKRANMFKNYNAMMDWPDMSGVDANGEDFLNITFEFRNLIEIA